MGKLIRLKNRLLAALATRIPAVSRRLVAGYRPWESEGIPWTPLAKPIARSTFAVVTTGGVHGTDQPPFNMDDPDGDPSYRVLDLEKPGLSLKITHDYYDHTDAERDLNLVFPIDRLREFAAEGLIGGLARFHYGLMGHIKGRHVVTLMEKTAPEIARRLRGDGVDAVLLVPG